MIEKFAFQYLPEREHDASIVLWGKLVQYSLLNVIGKSAWHDELNLSSVPLSKGRVLD